LNLEDVPTSDVLWSPHRHDSSAPSRLTAAVPCRFSSCDEVDTRFGFTCSVKIESLHPVKDVLDTDPGRLTSYRETLRGFRPEKS